MNRFSRVWWIFLLIESLLFCRGIEYTLEVFSSGEAQQNSNLLVFANAWTNSISAALDQDIFILNLHPGLHYIPSSSSTSLSKNISLIIQPLQPSDQVLLVAPSMSVESHFDASDSTKTLNVQFNNITFGLSAVSSGIGWTLSGNFNMTLANCEISEMFVVNNQNGNVQLMNTLSTDATVAFLANGSSLTMNNYQQNGGSISFSLSNSVMTAQSVQIQKIQFQNSFLTSNSSSVSLNGTQIYDSISTSSSYLFQALNQTILQIETLYIGDVVHNGIFFFQSSSVTTWNYTENGNSQATSSSYISINNCGNISFTQFLVNNTLFTSNYIGLSNSALTINNLLVEGVSPVGVTSNRLIQMSNSQFFIQQGIITMFNMIESDNEMSSTVFVNMFSSNFNCTNLYISDSHGSVIYGDGNTITFINSTIEGLLLHFLDMSVFNIGSSTLTLNGVLMTGIQLNDGVALAIGTFVTMNWSNVTLQGISGVNVLQLIPCYQLTLTIQSCLINTLNLPSAFLFSVQSKYVANIVNLTISGSSFGTLFSPTTSTPSSLVMLSSYVHDNAITLYSFLESPPQGYLESCLFVNNVVQNGSIIGVNGNLPGAVTINSTSIINNTLQNAGTLRAYTPFLSKKFSFLVFNSTIALNTAYKGGSMFFSYTTNVTLLKNQIYNNAGLLRGPSFASDASQLLWVKPMANLTEIQSGDILPAFSVTLVDDYRNFIQATDLHTDFILLNATLQSVKPYSLNARIVSNVQVPIYPNQNQQQGVFNSLRLVGLPGIYQVVIAPMMNYNRNLISLNFYLQIDMCGSSQVWWNDTSIVGGFPECVTPYCPNGCNLGKCVDMNVCQCPLGLEGLSCELVQDPNLDKFTLVFPAQYSSIITPKVIENIYSHTNFQIQIRTWSINNNLVSVVFSVMDLSTGTEVSDRLLSSVQESIRNNLSSLLLSQKQSFISSSLLVQLNRIVPIDTNFYDIGYFPLFAITLITFLTLACLTVFLALKQVIFDPKIAREVLIMSFLIWILYFIDWMFAFSVGCNSATCTLHLLLSWVSLGFVQGYLCGKAIYLHKYGAHIQRMQLTPHKKWTLVPMACFLLFDLIFLGIATPSFIPRAITINELKFWTCSGPIWNTAVFVCYMVHLAANVFIHRVFIRFRRTMISYSAYHYMCIPMYVLVFMLVTDVAPIPPKQYFNMKSSLQMLAATAMYIIAGVSMTKAHQESHHAMLAEEPQAKGKDMTTMTTLSHTCGLIPDYEVMVFRPGILSRWCRYYLHVNVTSKKLIFFKGRYDDTCKFSSSVYKFTKTEFMHEYVVETMSNNMSFTMVFSSSSDEDMVIPLIHDICFFSKPIELNEEVVDTSIQLHT